MIQTVINTLRSCGKGWGNAVFDDTKPNNFTVMPCLEVHTLYEAPAGEGDNKSFPIFHHWLAIDVWQKKIATTLKQREKMKKDVVLTLLQMEAVVVIEKVREIPDEQHFRDVIEFYCIGGKEDDWRRN